MTDSDKDDNRLDQARVLVKRLEEGDDGGAKQILDELAGEREFNLFKELGRLTRELHEAMTSFQDDTHLLQLASADIPDAKDRLNYVITMTEQAANRTLDKVEESIPISETIETQSALLQGKWQRFRSREMPLDEFKVFSDELDLFLGQTHTQSATLHANLTDVLMAQDYQDLTGQMIRRVISLVQDVEENMVGLIKITGMTQQMDAFRQKSTPDLEGPQIKAGERKDVVDGQDDVDDLLSSLGF